MSKIDYELLDDLFGELPSEEKTVRPIRESTGTHQKRGSNKREVKLHQMLKGKD